MLPRLGFGQAAGHSFFLTGFERRGEDAIRKAFKDAEFHREYKKLTGEEPDPLMPEEMEKTIREMPRGAEVSSLRCQK